ncbi:uncharacterized protein TNCV_967481 [Trichonephila clavipes]|nr:uncharacterized protein TNCV_967481 [Trichonephila clavipes]
MQGDCALRIACRGRLTMFSVEYKTSNQCSFECAESFIKKELRQTCHFRRHLSQFEGCHYLQYTVSALVSIHGTMTDQRFVHDILQPHVLPLMQRLPGAIFQQDNARRHTVRVSQDCLGMLLPPFLGLPNAHICLQSSLSGIIWGGELGITRV